MNESRHDKLAEAICLLCETIRTWVEQQKADNETKNSFHRLSHQIENLMQAIQEYANRVDVAFEAIGTSVDELVASQAEIAKSQTGIAGDVAGMKTLIEKLQNSPGELSPEDKGSLDALEVKVNSLVTKTAAVAAASATVAAALKALDELTAEVPPVEPPVE